MMAPSYLEVGASDNPGAVQNGKDCGVFERHQLTEAGAFELIEYREKTMCDGKVISPREWPLVYQRR
jgi:hypothetical protein